MWITRIGCCSGAAISIETINFTSGLLLCLAPTHGANKTRMSPARIRDRLATALILKHHWNPKLWPFQIEPVARPDIGRAAHAADRAELVGINVEVIDQVLAHVKAKN